MSAEIGVSRAEIGVSSICPGPKSVSVQFARGRNRGRNRCQFNFPGPKSVSVQFAREIGAIDDAGKLDIRRLRPALLGPAGEQCAWPNRARRTGDVVCGQGTPFGIGPLPLFSSPARSGSTLPKKLQKESGSSITARRLTERALRVQAEDRFSDGTMESLV